MMKSYLRYEPSRTIGVVASPSCNIATSVDGNLCMTGGVQDAQVWNLRTGERIATLTAENPNYPYSNSGETRCLRVSHDGSTMAVGYTSGDIRIFDYIKGTTLTTLHGHRSEVLCLVYESSATSTFLLSGGADTDIYLWDTVSLTGVCCLRGHKGPVTGLGLLSRSGGQLFVVSCSKDTLLKVWDVATQTCIQTVVGHRSEVWSLAVVGDHVVTGSSDEFLRCYKVCDDSSVLLGDEESVLELVGQVAHSSSSGSSSSRQSKCVQLCVNSSRTLLAAVSDHKTVELFRLRGAAELEKKQKRLKKRQREKESRGKGATGQSEWEAEDQGEANAEGEEDGEGEGGESDSSFQDLVEHVGTVRASAKVKSFTFSPKQHASASSSASVSTSTAGSGKGAVAGISERCILSTVDNCLATYGVSFLPGKAKSEVVNKVSQIDLHGHRSDVRCVAASDDGLLIATGSAEGVKTWSTNTFACVSSATVGYCTSLAFVRGGRFLVSGTREGHVQIVDSATGAVSTSPEAHAGAIWSVAVRPDGLGFMTGSADKFVKLWDLAATAPSGAAAAGAGGAGGAGAVGAVTATLSRQLQMSHDVLCVRYNSATKAEALMIAVGLLDCTTRVFFEDSLKFALTLYGHKLPVMCLDISYDGRICITGSADKTIKIWGLDFGDCHRSLVGHADSVTALRFQPQTHYFFSCGKDGVVKYWDADRFEQVLTLPGHKGAAWGLDVLPDASFAVSVGQDRSIRFWRRSDDLVFVEEEKERYLEAMADQALEHEGKEGAVGAEAGAGAGAVGRATAESARGGELVMDALDVVDGELAELEAAAEQERTSGKPVKRKPSPMLLNLSPYAYLVQRLQLIKQADLEQALLVLPFHYVRRLVAVLITVLHQGLDTEVVARCAVFLVRAHFNTIIATAALQPEVRQLSALLRGSVGDARRVTGENIAALKCMQRLVEEGRALYVGGEETNPSVAEPKSKAKGKGKKRKVL